MRIVCLLITLLFAQGISAQSLPKANFCLNVSDGKIAISMVVDSTFDGFISNIQGTIRADQNGISFSNLNSYANDFMDIYLAGPAEDSANFSYQRFVGLGKENLGEIQEKLIPNQPVLLFQLEPSDTSTTFEIVNDTWTTDHYGDYYIELNAEDKTGDIIYGCEGFILSDENHFSERIKIYPNPTTDFINIEAIRSSIQRVIIFDISGKKMFSRQYSQSPQSSLQLDISDLPTGVYLIKLHTPQGTFNQKIAKQ